MARAPNPHLKTQLLAAATEVFAAHGLATARVADITARAGTSKGAFYLHFETKEAAYVEIARGFLDDLIALLKRHDEIFCAAFTSDSQSRLQELDGQLMDFLWQRRRQLALVLSGAAGTSCAFVQDEFIDTVLSHMRESMEGHRRAMPELAEFLDTEFVATMAAGMIFMYARRMIHEQRPPFAVESLSAFRALFIPGACISAVPVSSGPTVSSTPAVAPAAQPLHADATDVV